MNGVPEGLSAEERAQAEAVAAAAQRAEERAEQRALERALQQKEAQRALEKQQQQQANNKPSSSNHGMAAAMSNNNNGVERAVFVPKRKRGAAEQQQQPVTEKKEENVKPATTTKPSSRTAASAPSAAARPVLSEKERLAIKKAYLGRQEQDEHLREEEERRKRKRTKTNKKITFKFRWDDQDDTYADSLQNDPLYSSVTAPTRQGSNQRDKNHQRGQNNHRGRDRGNRRMDRLTVSAEESVSTKPLAKMTLRDWRIFRENYEITVKGGKAPPPLRSFRESPAPDLIPTLHPALLDALENVMGFREPTPIQRQAIPIGLQRRDLIGIAETGSGKTVAFGVPLCHYLLQLPGAVLERVAEHGPLALVMAPTRELALQIDVELSKVLSRNPRGVKTCAVVGGQSIQQQAQVIRNGVHIIVGTPGRINDCIEMAYLVLNQCCYIVLDEADRMIDMGFKPQIESILDAMGGTLKSENETETYQQEIEDLKKGNVARHRLTAMFSATMPLEVERLAKQYLRHPAVVSIGDQDSRANARIVQRVIFVASPAQKEKALRDQIMDRRFLRDKVIVFVNEKKDADRVGRIVERAGRHVVVMHGGKSQDHREENLATFRKGGVVMVATDVAGRGLDIPDVAHVINYDLPTRSIENYTHRIGRTGRAGKEGLATSFITDEDQGIMAALKQYLMNTGNQVPDRLARHPAANTKPEGDLIY